MLDTAQPLAAETDPVADAAQAFKVSLGQADAPERSRDDRGRFASPREAGDAPDEDEEIEAAEADEAEAAENVEETDDDAETAEEAQSELAAMPSSWAKEDAEIWSELPPEAQARIAEREGQRDAAVNQKFQDAANLRKAHEADIRQARAFGAAPRTTVADARTSSPPAGSCSHTVHPFATPASAPSPGSRASTTTTWVAPRWVRSARACLRRVSTRFGMGYAASISTATSMPSDSPGDVGPPGSVGIVGGSAVGVEVGPAVGEAGGVPGPPGSPTPRQPASAAAATTASTTTRARRGTPPVLAVVPSAVVALRPAVMRRAPVRAPCVPGLGRAARLRGYGTPARGAAPPSASSG